MTIALIGIFLVIILILLAIKAAVHKGVLEDNDTSLPPSPAIHSSGIYSIVKREPRERTSAFKPPFEDITQYLEHLNEDIERVVLSSDDKKALVEHWEKALNENIAQIEKGDKEGVEFYYYDFSPYECKVCKKYFQKGRYVTREDIYNYPFIVPPLHLGCTTKLVPHHGSENIRETTALGMFPLIKNKTLPPLPEWKDTIKIKKTMG
ncbi:MAG: hypothetical protein N2053_04660 [Chitinispirillaceae bacterium]|nr:hypothetical protein [Chitinispirillaceae bacterium]